jgi:hypothetical protein
MSDKPDQISRIYTIADGSQFITLTDGTALELSEMDIDMLKSRFVGECEMCGWDPDDEEDDE